MADIMKAEIVGTPALNGTYVAEMDMWPLECQEFNRNYQFYENLKAGKFTTTKCKKCGHVAYPPGVICPKCWSDDLEWVELPQRAKVVTFTETEAGYSVKIRDIEERFLERGRQTIAEMYDKRLKRGYMTEEARQAAVARMRFLVDGLDRKSTR